jgi:RNA polymerase-interacting CarD/CdnL/TRCF family regulator
VAIFLSSRPVLGLGDCVLKRRPLSTKPRVSQTQGKQEIKMGANTIQKTDVLKMQKVNKDRCPWKGEKDRLNVKKERKYVSSIYALNGELALSPKT